MAQKIARVNVRWLLPEQGGRRQPFVGSSYAPTARFSGDAELFSVVVEFPSATQANPTAGKLNLLFPERLPRAQTRLVPGSKLELTEGPTTVAYCEVVAVENEP